MTYLHGIEKWREYCRSIGESGRRSTIFIVLKTTKDTIYIPEYKDWLKISDYIKSLSVDIVSVGLQWKTHLVEIDITDSDGVYIAQTMKGKIGGSSKKCMTIGLVYGDKVQKQLWSVPELIKDIEYQDDIKGCLKEALYIHDKKE